MDQQPPPPVVNGEFIINPLTKRKIKIGSAVYHKLVKDGVVRPNEVPLQNILNAAQAMKPCTEGKVRNPLTKICIQKKGALYKKLLKQGIVFHDDDLVHVPVVIAPAPPHAHTRQCKNGKTFLLQEDVHEIDENDFIVTPTGYCFSIDELVQWVKSDAFNNKDPYDINKDMFTNPTNAFWKKFPLITNAVNAYFLKARNDRLAVSKTILDNIDILYMIGNTGRVCFYDNMTSREANDSSAFEYSIETISNLTHALELLPAKTRKIFLQMKNNIITLEKTINDANRGAVCIHGVGINCMAIFVEQFTYLETIYKTLKYDPMKSGLYFVKDSRRASSDIILLNKENRISFIQSSSHWYTVIIKPIFKTIKKGSSMVWEMNKVRKEGLSPMYMRECPNDAYMSTFNTNDEWWEIEEWRKVRLIDGYCFDLIFLIKVIVDQLNTTANTNPLPQYPKNPFTKKIISMRDFINLRRRISNNYLNVADCLMSFLFNPEILWSDDETYANSTAWQAACIQFFEKDMRFMRNIDRFDENEFIVKGQWVNKKVPADIQEQNVLKFIETLDRTHLRGAKPYVTPLEYYVKYATLPPSLKHGYDDNKL